MQLNFTCQTFKGPVCKICHHTTTISHQPLPKRGELSLVLLLHTVSTIQYLCEKETSKNIFAFHLNATQSVLHFLYPLVQSCVTQKRASRVQSGADRGTVVPSLPVYHLRCFSWDSHLQTTLLLFICAALEGRAGMAAITLSKGQRFDSAAFYRHVVKFLPNYARPRFVRIQVCSVPSSSCSVTVVYPAL